MKEALLPILVQDPVLKNHKRIIEGYKARRDFFLDGPLTDTVAILDFDPVNGELSKGAHFNKGKIVGWFEDDRKAQDPRLFRERNLHTGLHAGQRLRHCVENAGSVL